MSSGKWEAIALPSVNKKDISSALVKEGLKWDKVSHITATASLGKSIRSTGANAVDILSIIDMVVMSLMPDKLAFPISEFPSHRSLHDSKSLESFESEFKLWRSDLKGRRIRLTFSSTETLKKSISSSGIKPKFRKVLGDSKRDLYATIKSLVGAGFSPEDIDPSSDVAVAAKKVWQVLEKNDSTIAVMRDVIWMDPEEFKIQKTPQSKQLRNAILAVMEQVFGKLDNERSVVYSGFYFFSSPQWAFFRLLRQMPEFNQYFIVHDDGVNPAFETWRRFFNERWGMPAPKIGVSTQNPNAEAVEFRHAMTGEVVNAANLDNRLELIECRNPSEFVRLWGQQSDVARAKNEATPKLFAPNEKDIGRFVERLGGEIQVGEFDLSQLPVGVFLINLHDSISVDIHGGVLVSYREEALLDIIGSGFLPFVGIKIQSNVLVAAFKRAMPFFRGCSSAEEWLARATDLNRLVIAEVRPFGEKNESQSDLDRMSIASRNPLRSVPWADLSLVEADAILKAVKNTNDFVKEIAESEIADLEIQLSKVRDQVRQGMKHLPKEQQEIIESRFKGFSVGISEEVSVDGLVDVVRMLLGQKANLSAIDDEDDGDNSDSGAVRSLKGLDALGLMRSSSDVHLANLADGSFPGTVPAIGWPFRVIDFVEADNLEISYESLEILVARSETAALSDMYLLWLALDGVDANHRVSLSWISDIGGEMKNPSPLLALLAQPKGVSKAVVARAGGLQIQPVEAPGDNGKLRDLPGALRAKAISKLHDTINLIDKRPAASAHVCARRFAIQWALGDSASFTGDHHHAMLYGNILGALERRPAVDNGEARRIVDDLWRQLTLGERASSLAKRRVRQGQAATEEWTLTLGGFDDNAKTDPVSVAYQVAKSRDVGPQLSDVMVPDNKAILPKRLEQDVDICANCPVRNNCRVWFDPDSLFN